MEDETERQDINGSTKMTRKDDGSLAQFTRDVLTHGIEAIENAGGEVVAFMGDASLAVLPDVSSAFNVCASIAKDLDHQCEWISDSQRKAPELWPYAPGGPGLKVAFEWGTIGSTQIASLHLGVQLLLIGTPINYACRISAAGEGNRCVCGPSAARLLREAGYVLEGPSQCEGTKSDGPYVYFELDLGDLWASGRRADGEDSYWG